MHCVIVVQLGHRSRSLIRSTRRVGSLSDTCRLLPLMQERAPLNWLSEQDVSSTRRSSTCVLLTGVASGLGLATARALAHEGMEIIGCDRDTDALDQLAAELGSRFRPVTVDVSSPGSVSEAARVVAAMQPDGLDAIVHFAGVHSAGALMDLTEAEFAGVLDINISGVWRVQRAFFALLRLRRGRTILISSEVAHARFCHPFSGGYSISKIALDNFATVLRQELRCLEPPMDVSVLHLGMFSTPLLGRAASSFGAAAARHPDSPFAPALLAGDSLARWYMRGSMAERAFRCSPERVAQKVIEVLEARSPRKRYGVNVSWAMGLVAALPPAFVECCLVAGLRGYLYGVGRASREILTAIFTALFYFL